MVIKGIESGVGMAEAFPAASGKKSASPAEGFGKVFGEMIDKVNGDLQSSDKAIQDLATGQTKALHEVMIAVEKANISFQFVTQVRNKAVEAYQEIMRMPV